MSEEEKKAIEWLEKAEFFSARLYAPIILNLVDKQQKEIYRLQNIKRKDIEDLINNEKENIYINYIRKEIIIDKIIELEDVLDLVKDDKKCPKYKKEALIEEISDLKEFLEENTNE